MKDVDTKTYLTPTLLKVRLACISHLNCVNFAISINYRPGGSDKSYHDTVLKSLLYHSTRFFFSHFVYLHDSFFFLF